MSSPVNSSSNAEAQRVHDEMLREINASFIPPTKNRYMFFVLSVRDLINNWVMSQRHFTPQLDNTIGGVLVKVCRFIAEHKESYDGLTPEKEEEWKRCAYETAVLLREQREVLIRDAYSLFLMLDALCIAFSEMGKNDSFFREMHFIQACPDIAESRDILMQRSVIPPCSDHCCTDVFIKSLQNVLQMRKTAIQDVWRPVAITAKTYLLTPSKCVFNENGGLIQQSEHTATNALVAAAAAAAAAVTNTPGENVVSTSSSTVTAEVRKQTSFNHTPMKRPKPHYPRTTGLTWESNPDQLLREACAYVNKKRTALMTTPTCTSKPLVTINDESENEKNTADDIIADDDEDADEKETLPPITDGEEEDEEDEEDEDDEEDDEEEDNSEKETKK